MKMTKKNDINENGHLVSFNKHGKIDLESFDSGATWYDRKAERKLRRRSIFVAIVLVVLFIFVILQEAW